MPSASESRDRLREAVHGTLHQEFRWVAADLERLRAILSDAAQRLAGVFRVMTASSNELQQSVRTQPTDPPAMALRRLEEIAARMSQTAGETVQSLQFEDMATQMLAQIDRRLAILEALSKEMAVYEPGRTGSSPHETCLRTEDPFCVLERFRSELALASRGAVSQRSLDSGEIELF